MFLKYHIGFFKDTNFAPVEQNIHIFKLRALNHDKMAIFRSCQSGPSQS